ncbi:hypothetical protein B2I21_07555 [Chryseobacterium mucoviscidosis]|nr:hypothetical protein B2I21_07555 [Chryseobacterium mucoviscidosis]
MRDSLIYIFLGFFDALAYILLSLKLYMLPIRENVVKVGLFALFISVFSFFMRMVFNHSEYDLAMQYVFFVVFLRRAIQIKTHASAFVGGAGITTYISFQLVLFLAYSVMGLVPADVISHNAGAAVYLIQIPAILIGLLVFAVLTLLKRGFTFIVAPPHDFLIKEDYTSSENRMMVIGGLVSVVTMILTVGLLYAANPYWLALTAVIALSASMYLSIRSDREDAIKNISLYRSGDK